VPVDRIAKYNQLLRIEAELGAEALTSAAMRSPWLSRQVAHDRA
jgi:enolase